MNDRMLNEAYYNNPQEPKESLFYKVVKSKFCNMLQSQKKS